MRFGLAANSTGWVSGNAAVASPRRHTTGIRRASELKRIQGNPGGAKRESERMMFDGAGAISSSEEDARVRFTFRAVFGAPSGSKVSDPVERWRGPQHAVRQMPRQSAAASASPPGRAVDVPPAYSPLPSRRSQHGSRA